ncbi:hypothetical protein [Flavobacterium sp.]|uniref:hypothetical protein n=1 Tax=Flavobacterium sp. TaxID=239 RepID=UPI004048077A
MFDFNKALKNANVYSIEYCGFFSLKFSIYNELKFYENFQDVKIEFISGSVIVDSNGNNYSTEEKVFDLYGLSVLDAKLTEYNQFEIEFENGYKILSVVEENDLVDRVWVFKITDENDNYIFYDSTELFFSESMVDLLKYE